MARTVDPVRHAARRGQIIEAAAEVFAEYGYDRATTAAICRRAGVGSGTLFHYFADKRAIFLAIVTDDLTANTAHLERLDRTDPAVALTEVLDLLTADYGDPVAPGLVAAMIQLAHRDEEFAEVLMALDATARAAVRSLISQGQASGVFTAPVDPQRAARWIVTLVDAGYLSGDDATFEAAADRRELHRIVASYLGWSSSAADG